MKKYRVTITRSVRESVILNVEAETQRDAVLIAGSHALQEEEWSRDVSAPKVGKVERVVPTVDQLEIPEMLRRAAP